MITAASTSYRIPYSSQVIRNAHPAQSNSCHYRKALTITLIVLGILAALAAVAFGIAAIATAMHMLWIGSMGMALAAIVMLGATLCTAKRSMSNKWTFERKPHDEYGTVYGRDDERPGVWLGKRLEPIAQSNERRSRGSHKGKEDFR